MGFSGSGKTFTASRLAVGLHQHCVQRGVMDKDAPVFFLDTETGVDWIREHFDEAGIKLLVDKTRAFTRLVPAVKEVASQKAILVIDSITHFWRELTESYAKQKRRTSLTFADWAWLKSQWGAFTDAFVNSTCHVVMCGRAGFEYDFFEAEDGKKELEKTGIRMKAEGETGYEPSLLVLMEQHQEMERGVVKGIYHTAHILKDRGNVIHGQLFRNPSFVSFLPHIERLNLGGDHVGVDTSETSENLVPPTNPEWKKREAEKEVVLDEIQCHLIKLYPGTKQSDKSAKMDLLEKHFGSRSWERIKTQKLHELRAGYEAMAGVPAQSDLVKQAEELF